MSALAECWGTLAFFIFIFIIGIVLRLLEEHKKFKSFEAYLDRRDATDHVIPIDLKGENQ